MKKTDAGEKAAIVAEQVRLLYEGALTSILSSGILAAILVYLQHEVVEPQPVLVWTALFLLTLTGRLLLMIFYRRVLGSANLIPNSALWLTRFRVGVVSAALVWGLASFLLFPKQDLSHQTFLAFTLAGLAAGAMATLAVDQFSATIFLLAILLPLAVRLLNEGQGMTLAMGAMVILYFCLLAVNARRICRDIVERKQAQIALEEREALLRKLSDRIPGVLFQFRYFPDGKFSVPYASSGLLSIFELMPKAVLNDASSIFSRIHTGDLESFLSSIQLSANSIAPWSHDFRVLLPERGERWLRGDSMPERLDDASVLWHGYFADVTERKLAEKSLEDARHQAEAANRAKSVFLSSMSHELRTPLNAVLVFSQLLEMDDSLSREQIDYVREIMRAGNHLLELVNEVLDLSKIESGKLDLTFEAVDCAALALDCLPLVNALAAKYGITIEIDDLSDLSLRADRKRLKQVLLNLMTNAIKYNRPNGQVRLHVMLGEEGQKRLAVSDTGRGIETDKLPLLFQPFSRLGAESGTIEGTGIGLVISQRIIEMMGGKIGAISEFGQGSTFWIELPLSQADKFEWASSTIR